LFELVKIQWWHDGANFGLYVIFDGKKKKDSSSSSFTPNKAKKVAFKTTILWTWGGWGGRGGCVNSPTKVMVIYLS
jgi:hypothetical protein